MAASDLKTFLTDLVSRWNPDVDLSDGSNAQTRLIQPILDRIGVDPFDEDIDVFVRTRIQQAYPHLGITEVDALYDTLIMPMTVLIEPVAREVKLIKLRSSLKNADALSDGEIDALMTNFFETRQGGGFARGVVRAYFTSPRSVLATIANPATTRGGLRYFPTFPQQITAEQMMLNIEGTEYYFDINYTAEKRGSEYNIDSGQVVSISNFATSSRVTNLRRFADGTTREGSLEFVSRTERKQGDKTLTVARGITSELGDNFPSLRKLQVIGFRDPEMRRDIIRGGGMGTILDDDDLGSAYGNDATFPDDLDGDLRTRVVESATGMFTTRVASVGSDPGPFYLSMSFVDGTFVYRDFRIVSVLSATQVLIEDDLPIGLSGVSWALRRKRLTVSDIPGGITLPDTVDGQLVLEDDTVHIGGKTDVYVAGGFQEESAQITSLTDESPLARGFDVETVASSNVLTVNDVPGGDLVALGVRAGMSVILEEGVDAGSYRIYLVSAGALLIEADMSGTQSNLSWRVVDEIDTELTEPKEIKTEGADLVIAAGSTIVTTLGSTNFIDANVQSGDVLRVQDDAAGGDYTVISVAAVTLTVNPELPRTGSGIVFQLFRASESVATPVVRVTAMELLDTTGAPVGTKIPYRDPVVAITKSFQNESSGFLYDGGAVIGLVSSGVPTTTAGYTIGVGNTLSLVFRNPAARYLASLGTASVPLTSGARTAAQIASEINGSTVGGNPFTDYARAVVLTYNGQDYVGVTSAYVLLASATDGTPLGWSSSPLRPSSNADVRVLPPAGAASLRVRLGDLIEFVSGNNTGSDRVLVASDLAGVPWGSTAQDIDDVVKVGAGPFGPPNTFLPYEMTPLLPEVGARIRIGRPSIGSARVYFLDPTSANFLYATTRFETLVDGATLVYRPDPDLQRTLVPAPPSTVLPRTGSSTIATGTFVDADADFFALGIQAGDLLELKFIPVVSAALTSPVLVSGLSLVLRIGRDNPTITINFPTDYTAFSDLRDYINAQVGQEIATISVSDELTLVVDDELTVLDTSTGLAALGLSAGTNQHPDAEVYVIQEVTNTTILELFNYTASATQADAQYSIRRYVQRVSSTEMNDNTDETSLYYIDVELLSMAPGDQYNIGSGIAMTIQGHESDGYRLSTGNEVTSYSRAEVLHAEISRTILLVGSSDSPTESVQMSRQNVRVVYDRSLLVDEIQSFADSTLNRVVNEEILVRHLLPNYVNLNWVYVGGPAEAESVRAIAKALDAVDPDFELEVGDLIDVLRKSGATSVYAVDSSTVGRTSPVFVVVYHEIDRRVRATVVRDFVNTGSRVQRFISGTVLLNRVTTTGLRSS